MKLRALQSTYLAGVYRRGPETDLDGNLLEGGEVFVVADDIVVNLDVFEIVKPPDGKKPKTIQPSRQAAPAAAGDSAKASS